MKAIKIDVVARTVTEINIKGDLQSMYETLDVLMVECIHLNPLPEELWVDEEGLLRDEVLGAFRIQGFPSAISGHGLILGSTPDGRCRSTRLTVDQIRLMITFVSPEELNEPHFTIISWE